MSSLKLAARCLKLFSYSTSGCALKIKRWPIPFIKIVAHNSFPITSALPDQGLQLRWQNSTDKEGCQRHALWSAVFYLFFLIPDPIGPVTACSSNWRPSWPNTPKWHQITNRIRDQFWSLFVNCLMTYNQKLSQGQLF